MRKVRNIFIALAVLLSDIMCAVVAYNFCKMQWGIRYAGFSAPAWVAFLYGIPYAIGIVVCVIVAVVSRSTYHVRNNLIKK